MKLSLSLVVLLLVTASPGKMEAKLKKGSTIMGTSIQSIDGNDILLNEYKGKALLIVNIATRCGFTGQLDELEKLNKTYAEKGLVVLGIPSNDFGGQTPEGEADVKKFCRLEYGVTFPLTAKVTVKGDGKHNLITKLLELSDDKSEIKWNFEKFLLNRQGEVVGRFESAIKPEDKTLTDAIEKVL